MFCTKMCFLGNDSLLVQNILPNRIHMLEMKKPTRLIIKFSTA